MFLNIQKNYKKEDYKKYHRKIIREQINNLLKYEKNTNTSTFNDTNNIILTINNH
jgi:hypothetical protein